MSILAKWEKQTFLLRVSFQKKFSLHKVCLGLGSNMFSDKSVFLQIQMYPPSRTPPPSPSKFTSSHYVCTLAVFPYWEWLF